MKFQYYILILVSSLFISCESEQQKISENKSKKDNKQTEKSREVSNAKEQNFDVEYFSGQAELATYSLKKARYEDVYKGEAVLVFVTEPFLIEEQVKADQPTPENSAKVLKLNRIDRFTTGIYDYSQYTSVFTPVEKYDAHYPLKITMGSQDWCGQSFTQLNNDNGFAYEHRSYFESEGDTSFHLDYVQTEDNLMNLIRLSKEVLPVGNFKILPGIHYLRTSHAEIKAYPCIAELENSDEGFIYSYEIPDLKRKVTFHIDTSQHNRITKWEESYPTVFDDSLRTSVYELKGVEALPYWQLNKLENTEIRRDLELMY